MVVGRLLSYWDDPFSGAMLNFAGVYLRRDDGHNPANQCFFCLIPVNDGMSTRPTQDA